MMLPPPNNLPAPLPPPHVTEEVRGSTSQKAAAKVKGIMNEGGNLLKMLPEGACKYRRRIPLPGFGVHPSWDKTSAADDSTCIERARDRVLEFLAQPLLSIWTLIAIVHLLLVVGVGAWFFFVFLDSAGPNNFNLSQDERDQNRNISIQVLNGLSARSKCPPQHGQSAPLAATRLARCASSGRACRLCAARHIRGRGPGHWAPSHCLRCSS